MILQPAARYPADPRAVFVLALSVFSGITALALEAAPGSLESLLPQWAVVLWSVLLSVGSAVTLTGMAFQSLNGIIVEQVGSVMVGSAAIFYATLSFWVIGTDAIQVVGIIAAWGLACFIRWVQLQVLINNAHRRQQKHEAVARLYEELEARAARELARRQARKPR